MLYALLYATAPRSAPLVCQTDRAHDTTRHQTIRFVNQSSTPNQTNPYESITRLVTQPNQTVYVHDTYIRFGPTRRHDTTRLDIPTNRPGSDSTPTCTTQTRPEYTTQTRPVDTRHDTTPFVIRFDQFVIRLDTTRHDTIRFGNRTTRHQHAAQTRPGRHQHTDQTQHTTQTCTRLGHRPDP